MRDHMHLHPSRCPLPARGLIDECKGLAENIETEAMRGLQGGKVIVPSKLFGDIDIPKDVITGMSNGDDDLWFNMSKHLDINIAYIKEWWFDIYPVKNGEIDTRNTIESGKL